MKKILKNKKILIIIIIIMGIILSGITYVAAQTLINSKDVIYTDNSKLNAGNVQEAIDGTCSKIDTRLSAIEDKLYTVTNIGSSEQITTSKEFVYTGVSITLPAKSYCSITVRQTRTNTRPVALSLNNSTTGASDSIAESGNVDTMPVGRVNVTLSLYINNARTFYVWASAQDAGLTNYIEWYGFCATKYKTS